MIRSELGRSDADHVYVRGFDLAQDLMGHLDLGGMAFLEIVGRRPEPGEAIVFNAMLVALVEHGITPSVIAARVTAYGAPESLQGAVAAGLLGLGSTFVGTIEGSAHMLDAAYGTSNAPIATEAELDAMADAIVADFRARRAPIPGLGHPIHREADPRTTRLFALAQAHGFDGRYVALMRAVARRAAVAYGKPLPLNATGAIGALACELGIPAQVARGLGVIARSVGLVGHLLEESRAPISRDLWVYAESEAERSRP
ncbi:MAG: citryl-CoA lyase [Candidatus Eremiobacteraeota bacterium]|nr:citryl-CoA lyase [Candidatus Eremiobacteraeota bacterium]